MTDLAKRRAELIAWAQSCLDSRDHHGLRDAAADLEVVEAKIAAAPQLSNAERLNLAEMEVIRLKLAMVAEEYLAPCPYPSMRKQTKRKRK